MGTVRIHDMDTVPGTEYIRARVGTSRARTSSGDRRTDPMSGRQAFDKLTKGFTPERRARVDARKAELRAAMPLHELRRTRKAVGDVLKDK